MMQLDKLIQNIDVILSKYPDLREKINEISELYRYEFDTPKKREEISYKISEILKDYIPKNRIKKINSILKEI